MQSINDGTFDVDQQLYLSIVQFFLRFFTQRLNQYTLHSSLSTICGTVCKIMSAERIAGVVRSNDCWFYISSLLCNKSQLVIDSPLWDLVMTSGQTITIYDNAKIPGNELDYSLIIVPVQLTTALSPQGVLGCYWPKTHTPTNLEMKILQLVATWLAGLVELRTNDNNTVSTCLEDTIDMTLTTVANIIELRDPYTAGHQQRVSVIATDIAEKLGWTVAQRKLLQRAALVHDIGKLGIAADLLAKPIQLTQLEYALIKTHVQMGYDILKDIYPLTAIARVLYQHHERLDGSGYPLGLTAEQILPAARIIAVADTFEALTSHRPYRPALGREVAYRELVNSAYDQSIVKALFTIR